MSRQKIYLVYDRPWRIEETDAEIDEHNVAITVSGVRCVPGSYALSTEQARQQLLTHVERCLAEHLNRKRDLQDRIRSLDIQIKELTDAQASFTAEP